MLLEPVQGEGHGQLVWVLWSAGGVEDQSQGSDWEFRGWPGEEDTYGGQESNLRIHAAPSLWEADENVAHGGQRLMKGQSWDQSSIQLAGRQLQSQYKGDTPREKPGNDESSCLKLQ